MLVLQVLKRGFLVQEHGFLVEFNSMALNIRYLKSAVVAKDYPPSNRPEVALAGRSNAGKSSFLNSISKEASVAKVSSAPGKTRLLNFFDVGDSYRIVDMPGYGFSRRAADEQVSWTEMIETYLSERTNLAGLILLMDIRREWTPDEELLAQFLRDRTLPFCVVATKTDKLKRQEIAAALKKLQKATGNESIFTVSNLSKTGVKEVEDFVYSTWVKGFRPKVEGA